MPNRYAIFAARHAPTGARPATLGGGARLATSRPSSSNARRCCTACRRDVRQAGRLRPAPAQRRTRRSCSPGRGARVGEGGVLRRPVLPCRRWRRGDVGLQRAPGLRAGLVFYGFIPTASPPTTRASLRPQPARHRTCSMGSTTRVRSRSTTRDRHGRRRREHLALPTLSDTASPADRDLGTKALRRRPRHGRRTTRCRARRRDQPHHHRGDWVEVLRLAASIRAGVVPPSVILKKLAAFPRQNALHRALREMGRLERAIFTCDWLLDPELRSAATATRQGREPACLGAGRVLPPLG